MKKQTLVEKFYREISKLPIRQFNSKEDHHPAELKKAWYNDFYQGTANLHKQNSVKQASETLFDIIKSAQKSIYLQDELLMAPVFNYEIRSALFDKVIAGLDVRVFTKKTCETENLIQLFQKRNSQSVQLTEKPLMPMIDSFCVADGKALWMHNSEKKCYIASPNAAEAVKQLEGIVELSTCKKVAHAKSRLVGNHFREAAVHVMGA